MTVATRRRLRTATLLAGLLPTLLAAALLRPLPAGGASGGIGFYALTYSGAAVAPQGEIGAGGGLLPLDGGAPLVRGRAESAPASSSVAASVEPGTLWATVAGVANTEAGEEVVPTPTRAEALYPGNPEASASQFGPEEAGPLTVGLGTALATAKDGLASGRAELATWRLTGQAEANGRALGLRLARLRVANPDAPRVRAAAEDDAAISVHGGRAFGEASATATEGRLAVRARASVQELHVAGQLVIRGLAGQAEAAVAARARTARAELSIADAALGDFPVRITTAGVELADQGVPTEQTMALNAQLNEALAAAGIRVALLPPTHTTGDGTAEADSGGLLVSLDTPSAGGVPGNTVGVVLGRVAVTSADEATVPGGDAEPLPSSDPAAGGLTDGSDDDAAGGFAGVPVAGDAGPSDLAPGVAPPAAPGTADTPRSVVLAGRVIPASVALAAFAVWQLLSLSTSTLAALALRDREELA